jgi:hypothetical protein
MQRRVLVSEDDALASNERRVELTPFFWQGLAGGFAALVLTGLVFMILTFSQVAQTLTEVKDVALIANSIKEISICSQSHNSEWMFMQESGLPAAYQHQVFSYINLEQMTGVMGVNERTEVYSPVGCSMRTTATCLELNLADVWSFLNSISSTLRGYGIVWQKVCSSGADGVSSDYGLVMNALCEAAAIYPPTQGHSNPAHKYWPCFALLSGRSETADNFNDCYTHDSMARQLEIEKDVVMSLASKLPPPCQMRQYSLQFALADH